MLLYTVVSNFNNLLDCSVLNGPPDSSQGSLASSLPTTVKYHLFTFKANLDPI